MVISSKKLFRLSLEKVFSRDVISQMQTMGMMFQMNGYLSLTDWYPEMSCMTLSLTRCPNALLRLTNSLKNLLIRTLIQAFGLIYLKI